MSENPWLFVLVFMTIVAALVLIVVVREHKNPSVRPPRFKYHSPGQLGSPEIRGLFARGQTALESVVTRCEESLYPTLQAQADEVSARAVRAGALVKECWTADSGAIKKRIEEDENSEEALTELRAQLLDAESIDKSYQQEFEQLITSVVRLERLDVQLRRQGVEMLVRTPISTVPMMELELTKADTLRELDSGVKL